MKAKVAKERNCKDKAKENGHNRGLRAEISPSQQVRSADLRHKKPYTIRST